MVNKISVQNFKSWKKTGEVRLAPLTGLFGNNSSGKTSILQLLLMLKQTTESSDRAQVLNLGDDRSLVELGTFKDIVYKHEGNSSLKLGLSWQLKEALRIADPEQIGKVLFEDNALQFQAEIDENGLGRMSVANFSYDFAKHRFGMKRKSNDQYTLFPTIHENTSDFKFKRPPGPGRPWDLPSPVKCYGFPPQARGYYQNAGFLSDLELVFEELFSHVYYLGPLREYPKRQYTWAGAQPSDMGRKGERVVDALLSSRERTEKISQGRGRGRKRLTVEEYVAWWLKELNLIHNFSVKPITEGSNLYQVLVQKSPNSSEVLITDVGFGVSQILPVLTLCYYVPEGSTILMEQPEIHLHPSVQAGLADVFIDAIKTHKVQIIIESHSEHLLKRLQRRIAEEEISNTEAALYFCDMADGNSKMTPLDLDMFGNIVNWPQNFFGDEFGEMAAMTKAMIKRKKREKTNAGSGY